MYIFLPYLMGERSPHNNPNARATFIGMTMDTTRADMTQAVLEGVAFALRDSFEVAQVHSASRSSARRSAAAEQRAHCGRRSSRMSMNLKVDVIESEEGPALRRRDSGGSCMRRVCICRRCGREAGERSSIPIEPDPELVEKYEARYQQFRQIYPTCKELFPKIL